MATVPLSGTNIRLLSGIPFSNDFKHTRWFDDQTSQTNYFFSKPTKYVRSQHTFQRIEGHTFISVNESIDSLWGSNYLMFQNAEYNNKWFYGFVTKLEYINKGTTYVHFEIDIFQTWLFEMNFKPSFVIREHRPLWNADGSPVINTVDEGLNYGTQYETVQVENYLPYDGIYFLVMVSKSAMHTGDNKITPVLNGLPQPLSFYVHPFKLDGSSPNIMVGDLGLNATSITDVLKNIYSQDDSVNNIVSLYVTEFIGYNIQYNEETDTINLDGNTFTSATIGTINTIYLKQMAGYTTLSQVYPNKYSGYNTVKESKLLMYPYTVLTLDDFKGNRIDIKNEYIKSQDISITVKGSIGTENKVSYNVNDYLIKDGINYEHIVSSENALINNTPNDVPIISDYLSAYLQGNRNQIQNQKNSIIFNGTMGAVSSGLNMGANIAMRNPVGAVASGMDLVQGAGNTVLQIQGINAKQKDIANTPPSMVKMGGNTMYDYGNDYKGLYVLKKQITAEYQKKLSDFFNMYGYKTNEVKIPNFHTRRFWNYVQTSSCTITGDFNNQDLNELKAVFDSGITLWHTDDVGNYSLENEVI